MADQTKGNTGGASAANPAGQNPQGAQAASGSPQSKAAAGGGVGGGPSTEVRPQGQSLGAAGQPKNPQETTGGAGPARTTQQDDIMREPGAAGTASTEAQDRARGSSGGEVSGAVGSVGGPEYQKGLASFLATKSAGQGQASARDFLNWLNQWQKQEAHDRARYNNRDFDDGLL